MVKYCYVQQRTSRGVVRCCYVWTDDPTGLELVAWGRARELEAGWIEHLRSSRLPVYRLHGKRLRHGCPVAEAVSLEEFKSDALAYARRNDVRLRVQDKSHGGMQDAGCRARPATDH